MKQLANAEALKTEKQDKERELQNLTETSGASGHQKLRVCDICGAYLSILDSDRRLADHFGGKVSWGSFSSSSVRPISLNSSSHVRCISDTYNFELQWTTGVLAVPCLPRLTLRNPSHLPLRPLRNPSPQPRPLPSLSDLFPLPCSRRPTAEEPLVASYPLLLQEELKIDLQGTVIETVEEISAVPVEEDMTIVIEIEIEIEGVVVVERVNIVLLLQGTTIIVVLLLLPLLRDEGKKKERDLLPREGTMRDDILLGERRTTREVRRGGRRRMKKGRGVLLGELMRREKKGPTRTREGELIEERIGQKVPFLCYSYSSLCQVL